MDVASILEPSSVRCEPHVGSKKHALEILSEMLAAAANGPKPRQILEGLAARERLGSTAIGSAVAMPHTRIPELKVSVGAFLKLATPVDFDSPDGKPVDLLFGLLVPDGSSREQLAEIRDLVKKLCDPELQRDLRAAEEPADLHDRLNAKLGPQAPRPVQRSTGR